MSRGKFREELLIRMMASQEVTILCMAMRRAKLIKSRRSAAYESRVSGQISIR